MGLRRFTWRSLQQRPGRALLTLLSIIIGVAATVSFAVTTNATRDAYRTMFALVTGRAGLEVTSSGDARFAESWLEKIREVPGVGVAVPSVRRLSTLFANGQRVNLQVLGIDPEQDRLARDYEIPQGRMVTDDDELLLDISLAERLQIKVGDGVKLLTERGLQSFRVAGIVEPQGGMALRQAGTVLISLKRAQYIFRAAGKLDVIQVVVKSGVNVEEVQARIRELLPDELQVQPPTMNSQSMKETLFGSEQALRLASLFSLLLAAFIILNTFLMNVSERKRQLAVLRAIGALGGQVRRAILSEGAVLGVLGTILGIVAGLFVADAVNRTLAEVLNVTMSSAQYTPRPFILAVLFGMGMSLAGAYVPAYRAGMVSPLEGLDRVSRGELEGVSWRYLATGFILVLVSSVVIILSLLGYLPLILPTYFSVSLLLGVVLISPLALVPLATFCSWCLRPIWRFESQLALKQILRHRTRATLTAGVLFVAGSTGVGIAYTILDNVDDVRDWYRRAFVADYFIRAMIPDMTTGDAADLPTALTEQLHKLPHLKNLEGASMVSVRLGENRVLVASRDFHDSSAMAFDLVSGSEENLYEQLKGGEVVIGSGLGLREKLTLGDDVVLETSEGPVAFRIAGVANDYLAGGYSIYMDRAYAVQYFGVSGYDAFLVHAEPAYRDELRGELQKLCDEHGVLIHSFADIVKHIEFMISGIVACLWALIALGFVVGAFGIVNTLTMNVLEQTRELGMLRIIAMTRRQVRRTILAQAIIMAGVGLLPGILGGLIIAWVMNFTTMPTIGHPVELGFRPVLVTVISLGALLIVLVAAWIPAARAARLDLVRALHYE